METIVLKEQLSACKCPYCTREFVIIKGLDTPMNMKETKEIKEIKEIKPEGKQAKPKIEKQNKKHSWKSWTQEDDNILKEMYAKGFGAKRIANKLGRTVQAIYVRKEKVLKLDGKMGMPELETETGMNEMPEMPETNELKNPEEMGLEVQQFN